MVKFIPNIFETSLNYFISSVGIVLILSRFYIKRSTKINNYLVLFWFATLLSFIVNLNYGHFFENLKELIWCATSLFLVFNDFDNSKTLELFKKFFVFLQFLFSFTSVALFFSKIGKVFLDPNDKSRRILLGFVEGRLFGLSDPNYASILSLICIIVSFKFLVEEKNKFLKFFYIFNTLVQANYISLSGSRTCIVSFMIVTLLSSFSYSFHFFKKNINKFLNIAFSLCVACLSCFLVINFLRLISEISVYILNSTNFSNNLDGEKISLIRDDVMYSSDISNARFRIWKNAWKIFKTSWLFGTSPRLIVDHAIKKFPSEYIATKRASIHNGYINVLVSTGLVGSSFFFLFMFRNISMIAKRYVLEFTGKIKTDLNLNILVISVIVIMISNIFLNEIIFVNTICALIFWLFLGKINRLLL
ncbi:MAG: O-antigen ligase family protein [Firmicutes bacterium]|nr:O-antigen ligase family protein [Bacillota bacterium]